jgi:hypothetical protein
VNKKQCPKCGEENPPEAVMCWACYTPLSGGGAAGGASTAGGGAASAATHDDSEKKKIPPWQLGVIGAGLLLVVGIGVRSMMPASSSDDDGGGDPPPANTNGTPASPTMPSGPAPSPSSPGGGGNSITPQEAPYKIVVPPNPRLSVGTMAIVPTDGNASGPQAASYAASVRRQFGGQVKRWNTIYIYVFSDEKTAAAFADFMRQRRGAALSGGDYATLSSLWSSTLARYEYSPRSGKERALYPSKNPSNWWYGNN